jgi:hypothetical protein
MDATQTIARYWDRELACSIVCGAVFAMPAWDWIRTCARGLRERLPIAWRPAAEASGLGLQLLVGGRHLQPIHLLPILGNPCPPTPMPPAHTLFGKR